MDMVIPYPIVPHHRVHKYCKHEVKHSIHIPQVYNCEYCDAWVPVNNTEFVPDLLKANNFAVMGDYIA